MDKGRSKRREPVYGEGEHWGVDPLDVRRHARRMREAKAVGPLGRLFRVAVVVLLVAVAFLIFWNRENLQNLRFDFSGVTSLFRGDTPRGARETPGEPGTEVVEDSGVAGVRLPTSLDGVTPESSPDAAAPANEAAPRAESSAPSAAAPRPDAEAPAAAERPAATQPPAASEPAPAVAAADDLPASEPRAAVPEPERAPAVPEPELPPTPETLGFGLNVMHVSEADASAAVLVLRDGGRREVSPFTWWTVDGTASAGSDFARLEPRVERFARGEQNRTIYVPIVGDRSAEGPEIFYVRVVAGESRNENGPIAEIEVIIDDDD